MKNIPGEPVETDVTAKFRDKLASMPDLREIFDQQVKSVVWKTKLATGTVQIPRGTDVEEIEIFWLDVNDKKIDERIIRFFDRKIAYHLIFILENKGKTQIWLSDKVTKETDESYFKINRYYHTRWFPSEMLYLFPDGNNLDNLYHSLFQQIQQLDKDAVFLYVLPKIAKHSQAIIEAARKHIPLSQQELEKILENKPLSDRQKEKITNSYLRVAIWLAYKFYRYYDGENEFIDEHIADACAGIMNAVDSYDANIHGYFSSYVQRIIWSELERQKEKREGVMYFPTHIHELLHKMKLVDAKFYRENSREPTLEEYVKIFHLSPARIRELLNIRQSPISVATPIGEDEDSILEDFIQDNSILYPEDNLQSNLQKQFMQEVLATLSEREAIIVRLRFGIDSGTPCTLAEIAERFNITKERVRQIEAKAIRKLRHPSRTKVIKDYWD